MNRLAVKRKLIAIYVDAARESARALASDVAEGFRTRGY
jgi:hypothetical protein